MCMVSLYLLTILCCHTIDWDIFLRYWCLSQIYYYIISNHKQTTSKYKNLLREVYSCEKTSAFDKYSNGFVSRLYQS